MRAFLALEVDQESVIREMLKAQDELGRTGADLKLVERENLHFTVKFFGEISEEEAEEVGSRLKGLDLRSMEVHVAGVGAFPEPRRPRVVWAGVSPRDSDAMVRLGEGVIGAVRGIGEPDDRGYHPHVTLARVRSPRNGPQLARFLAENGERPFGVSTLRTLKLKSSTLTPRGPVYSDVKTFELK